MNQCELFSCSPNVVREQIKNEIHSQLYNLRIHTVEFLYKLLNSFVDSNDEIIILLKSFLDYGIEIYHKTNIDVFQILQVQSQILKIVSPYINDNDLIKCSRCIVIGMILHKLLPLISVQSNIISELYCGLFYDDNIDQIDLKDLENVFMKQPYQSQMLMENFNLNLFDHGISFHNVIEAFKKNPDDLLNFLIMIGQKSKLSESDENSIKMLIAKSDNKTSLLKHITIEIGSSQTAEQRFRFSNFLRKLVIDNLLASTDSIPGVIVDINEKLLYLLIVNNKFPLTLKHSVFYELGWLILITNFQGTIQIILSLIHNLIEAQLVRQLCSLLQSKCMVFFNPLLLVNLWRPDLANVVTMEVLLDTCFPTKSTYSQLNYVEQLCLKIRNRWDTLKKFNSRLSFMNTTTKPSCDVLSLTAMGNTSHLELITGLSDPTGLEEHMILDLIERTGCNSFHSLSENETVHLESEILEDDCDKSIYFSAVSIRKVWECMILSSPIKIRQLIIDYIHSKNSWLDVELIDAKDSFFVQFRSALEIGNLELSEEIYQKFIFTRLEYLKNHVNLINPASLRLELLENIYSLLFITEYDLFTQFLSIVDSTNSRNVWPWPETIKTKHSRPRSNSNVAESIPKLNKNRFICSIFLLKDLLACIERHLMEITAMDFTHFKFSKQNDIDTKMACYINYPAYHEIKPRIEILSKSLHSIRWRINLLTTNQLDFTYDSIGIIDMPINVLFDNDSRQFSDIFRPRVNRKMRSRSTTLTYKPSIKIHKKKSVINIKDTVKNSDYRDESFDEENQSVSFRINKEESKYSAIRFPGNRETSASTSDNDYQLFLTSVASSTKPKMNCRFLMESIPWIIQPVEHLAITALVCGYQQKAQIIAEVYKDVDIATKNPLLHDLLTEIRYRGSLEKFVEQLRSLKTSLVENEQLVESSRSFGHFDWTKLQGLSAKISSNKENEIVEIVNHLLMLNFNERPFLKLLNSDENQIDQIVNPNNYNNKKKDFDSGLLLDLALNGSNNKWQLVQMLYQVELHYSDEKFTIDNKTLESTDYHKFIGVKPFVKHLQDVLANEYNEDDNETYAHLEMRGAMEIDYSTKMQRWLSKLKVLNKELEFNIKNSLEFQSYNPDSETRLTMLIKLNDFVKKSLSDLEMPFKYLIRNSPHYLEALQNHLQIFAKFLDEHKHSGEQILDNQSPAQQSYLIHAFSVLKRSPSDVLGELIFYKFVNPSSDEISKISRELGLNISEVILDNCLPAIYTSATKIKTDFDSLRFKYFKRIRNLPNDRIINQVCKCNPMNIVETCLESVFRLLLKHSYKCCHKESNNIPNLNESGLNSPSETSSRVNWRKVKRTISSSSVSSFETNLNLSISIKESPEIILVDCDSKVLLALSQEEEWIKIMESGIVELSNVDLNLLVTNFEKTAFFINLYNLMMIHMMVWIVKKNKINLKYRSFESRKFRETFCYKVGQIGVISIYEISQYYLNIPDVTFSDLDTNSEDFVGTFPLEIEQKYMNTCPNLQMLSVFSISDGTVSGPPLKIYRPETILSELQNTLSSIIKHMAYCDPDKRQIHLPQIFKWFNKHILLNSKNRKSGTKCLPRTEENLVERILSNCNDDIYRKYSHLLRVDTELISYNTKEASYPKSIKIIWLARSEAIGCSLIERIQDSTPGVSKPIDNEFLKTFVSDDDLSSSAISQSNNIPSTNYHPRTGVIDHLRQKCPILACLVYTIIGDDFLSSGNMFDSNTDSRSSFEDINSEINSYKYSRLNDNYRSIGKWITRYWSSWHANNKISVIPELTLSSNQDSLLSFCRDNIPIEIRWAAFNHPMAKNLDVVLIDYSIQYMNRNPTGYLLIGFAMRNLHSLTFESNKDFRSLLDMILIKSAQSWAAGLMERLQVNRNYPPDNTGSLDESIKYKENRLLDCLYAINDNNIRLAESYRYLNLLSIDNVVILMETNAQLLYPHNEKILQKLEVFRIFKRIYDLVYFCQSKDEIFLKAYLPTEFLNWTHLQSISESNPNEVFKFLIQQKRFDLCRKWCQFFMKENGEEKTAAEYIVSFVSEESDKVKVVQLISHISKLYMDIGVENFLKIIHHVIAHSEVPFSIIICCGFIIKNDLFSKLSNNESYWQNRIKRAWTGASMLRSIPNGITRDLYSHLVEHPELIMEQLLMNSEIELFRKMLELYKEQKKVYLAIKRSQNLLRMPGFNHEELIEELEPYKMNKLLIEYIFKALELPAVRGEGESESDDSYTISKLSSRRNSVISGKNDINSSCDSIFGDNYNNDTSVTPHAFLSPERWIQDRDASVCMCCKKEMFSMFNRRHHCRKCGWVVCGVCSTHRTMIKGVTVRICTKCHKSIHENQYSNSRVRNGSVVFDDNKYRSSRDILYTRYSFTRQEESPRSNSSLTNVDMLDPTPNLFGEIEVGNLQSGWKLSIDSSENELIRQMFFYDDAPSITMAFSLTSFHSNSNECGNSLLDRVEYLAEFLKPMKSGLPNSEVDYLLVIDIAKRITYKAKEKFSFTNNDVDFARAEVYFSRLDLLGILVRSNYSHYLPSLGDGSKFIEKIKCFRDKLIAEERLELAQIVSNKASLPNYPVFVAMGLHDLEEGKYDEARKLFKSSIQFGLLGPSNSSNVMPYPLNEIIKILERQGLSVEKLGEMIENIRDYSDLLKCPESRYMKECDISQKQIEEAIFYYELFNAPLHHLRFLCRQQIWSKAVDFVIKKNVSKDVFIDGLIAPTVSSGMFSLLKKEMLMREGGLLNWKNYYEPLCSYLDKNRCFQDLLEIQESNGDYLRAATTLIKHFYLSGANSYLDLERQLPYLEKASKYFEKLIRQSSNASSSETEKYMKNHILINQQIEATKFLSNHITISPNQVFRYVSKSIRPPTLFEQNPDSLVDLCLMILFCRPNILDGLHLLHSMMPKCHLYPEKILPKAAIWLLDNPKFVRNSVTLGIDSVLDLCNHIHTCYKLDSRKSDEILIAILEVIPTSVITTDVVKKFTSLLNNEQKKIKAYILVKDFRRAYTQAIKLKYVSTVEEILELAKTLNDKSGVIDLCEKWLVDNRERDK